MDTSSANKILNNIITGSTFDVIFSHVSINNEFASNNLNDHTQYYYDPSYVLEVGQPPSIAPSPSIPEFPTWTVLPSLLIAATMISAFVRKRIQRR